MNLRAIIAAALFLVVAGLAAGQPSVIDEWSVENSDSFVILHQVTEMWLAFDDELGLEFKLFETAGGDPVINGDRLWLTIAPFDRFLEPRAFVTDIDVAGVSSFTYDVDNSRLVAETGEMFMEDDGSVSFGDVVYHIYFEFDPEYGIAPEIFVEKVR